VFTPVPVVILASSREERDLVEGYEIGVNAYVVKPVNFHQFVDAVKALGGFWAVLNGRRRPAQSSLKIYGDTNSSRRR